MLKNVAILISLLAPLLLAWNLFVFKPKSKTQWMMAAWLVLAFSLFDYLTGAWFILSFYARYVVTGLVVFTILVSWLCLPGETPMITVTDRQKPFTLISYLVPALIFSVLSVSALMGYRYRSSAVPLKFPLKDGSYYIAQGGGTSIVNAHHAYGSQVYAMDILQLDRFGRNAAGFQPAQLERYVIYGTPVYSPCQGRVAAVADGLDDLQPGSPGDTRHPAGNHIYIDCQAENVQILLAHLKKGSLVVKEGNPIGTGDLIGQVGNSGNSSEPHLHIHARQSGNLESVISGTGIPILFNEQFFVRNTIWTELFKVHPRFLIIPDIENWRRYCRYRGILLRG